MAHRVWIDIANTAEIPFFKPIISELKHKYQIYLTCWKRGEVPELLRSLGFQVKPILSDFADPIKKALSVGLRTSLLTATAPKFDAVVTMENVMPLPSAYLRRKTSIIILDNDVKLNAPQSIFQRLENRVKKLAKYVLVPEIAYDEFSRFFGKDILTYPGIKEHVSISDYVPDPEFLSKVPFEEYIVLRPESLASHYVLEKESIVPELLDMFTKEGVNIIYLPRNKAERALSRGFEVYIPPKPLNGLDLSYYSNAVLTGSGTMAREAALLGVLAVSFFPGKQLLAIDKYLIEKGEIFHSRDPRAIVEYVISNLKVRKKPKVKEGKKIKAYIISLINDLIDGSILL
ncbi:DUF354 domain-containing protein [Pyrococcus abyssi]|uniref:DUF354 domain-containing protein n=1 Tax=Pyrococcus abyssi (strain GE5 / Orsay) TaxID=272844 RepID=Q9UZF8_PYRAB|nr:DUF354 domain-containing protein [Pyrococcus abyssi]CAB50101.1 Hypothetical protein PAB1589 [Pyrococcus abyssi GE5]CCE70621.1 TPA: hypothetical protein PAB1589 [Pyrococcus abyssi GE5]